MPKITNLKTEEINVVDILKKAKNKVSDTIAKAKKEFGYDLLDLAPKESYNSVEFYMKDCSASFANAIRRTLVSEMPIWSLELDMGEYYTDDPYLRFDDLATKIGSVPIHQTYINKLSKDGKNPNSSLKFKLYVNNNTPEYKNAYTDDIVVEELKESIIPENVPLQTLCPNCFLRIKMKLVRGYGYENSANFSAIPMTHYNPSNIKPLETRYKKPPVGESSLETNPREFYLKYETYIYYKNPLEIMVLCIEEIKRRVADVMEFIHKYNKRPVIFEDIPKDLKDKVVMYKNEIMEIRKESHTYMINIKGESTTISQLFSRYISELHKGIALVTDSNDHPSVRAVTIKIQDDNAIKLMLKAGEKIINDMNAIKKSFA